MYLSKNKKLPILVCILMIVISISSISFTHSGRTDGYGGHKDNKNASGLGSYHYHHGQGPHLHPKGVCPYTITTMPVDTSNSSSSSSSSDTSTNKEVNKTSGSVNTLIKPAYVIVSIPKYDVWVNDVLIDTLHSQYPVISYKNITYFPMTSDYLAGIGLDLSFSATDGLKINVKDEIGILHQKFLGVYNILGSEHGAQVVTFNIEVNGKHINNSIEDYPVLLYKDITYFPMTWRFSVTEFMWTTKWSEDSGFSIVVE